MWWCMYICARVQSVEDSGGAGKCSCILEWLCMSVHVCLCA